jgi:hypothetical protein
MPYGEYYDGEWFAHRDWDLAVQHAEILERITGDHCEVFPAGPTGYWIVRTDPSGKEVE